MRHLLNTTYWPRHFLVHQWTTGTEGLITLKFCTQSDTKYVASETFFAADLLTSSDQTKLNITEARNIKYIRNKTPKLDIKTKEKHTHIQKETST